LNIGICVKLNLIVSTASVFEQKMVKPNKMIRNEGRNLLKHTKTIF